MGAGQKKYPPKDFLAIFPQTTKKLNKKYTLFYTQNYKKKFSNFHKLICHIKHDYVMNFYITIEKREKLQYLYNSTTDLHKI